MLNSLTKLGEGYSNPEGHIPIDIHINKLLEWLVDRRKIPSDWKKQLQPIGLRVKDASSHLPDSPLLQKYRDSMQPLTYFDCLEILKLLPQTGEDETKNLFGTYNSKVMKEWNDIIRSYESNFIYLGELASNLVNIVNVELPQMSKTIDRCNKSIMELERKDGEYNRSIQNYKSKYQQACQSLGVKGENVETEVPQLIQELPTIFDRVVVHLRQPEVTQAILYYREFNKMLSLYEGEQLNLLEDIQKNGNRPNSSEVKSLEKDWNLIEDYRPEGEKEIILPTKSLDMTESIIELPAPSPSDDENVKGEEEPVIQMEEPVVQTEEGEISWDVEDSNEISWDIGDGDVKIELVEASEEKKEEETILGNAAQRHKFVGDLMELYGFLEQRLEDVKAAQKEESGYSLFEKTSEVISEFEDVNKLQKAIAAVKLVVNDINSNRTKQLLDIKTSNRYSDRIISGLKQLTGCVERCLASLQYSQSKKQEHSSTIESTRPLMLEMTKRMSEMKQVMEAALSKQYNGREVHIVGEINNY
ncbi:hypothetical protein PROFUN_07928 [Planoprotostelium fungivorum]|uniref:CDK5 regulatory subunit-associated protein 3 n=1 Tax=Planoprotostelium fungivorum TaxID=1890364 RepID=A0A2P6NL71_9EUKA|nr:hypothetical protein PROFUN_07928 [Planoprotostelium fungivorum]